MSNAVLPSRLGLPVTASAPQDSSVLAQLGDDGGIREFLGREEDVNKGGAPVSGCCSYMFLVNLQCCAVQFVSG